MTLPIMPAAPAPAPDAALVPAPDVGSAEAFHAVLALAVIGAAPKGAMTPVRQAPSTPVLDESENSETIAAPLIPFVATAVPIPARAVTIEPESQPLFVPDDTLGAGDVATATVPSPSTASLDKTAVNALSTTADLPHNRDVDGGTDEVLVTNDTTDKAPSQASSPTFNTPLLVVRAEAPREVEAPRSAPETVRRDTSALAVQLQDKLARVIERMESEYGYRVEVVETTRTQERQNQLYAQGRTEPGAIVTWTRESKHTQGMAVDVRIDGGWENAEAFARLAVVAEQEGLRTLGPKDPGHLEIPSASVAASKNASREPLPMPAPLAVIERPKDVVRAPSIARVADVAQIAPVAQVAVVASVARVGDVAAKRAETLPTQALSDKPATLSPKELVLSETAQAVASASLFSSKEDETTMLGSSRDRATARSAFVASELVDVVDDLPQLPLPAVPKPTAAPSTSDLARELARAVRGRDDQPEKSNDAPESRTFSADLTREGQTPMQGRELSGERKVASSVQTIEEVARTDATERIARVLRLQDGNGDRTVSSVVLRLDGPDGREDRIRVDLRGGSVGTTFDVRDAAAADRMRAHAPELQRALERQGLESEAITIRTAPRAEPSVNSASLAVAEREAVRAGASSSGSSSQFSRDTRQHARPDDFRREPQRDRRHSRGEKNA